MRRRPEQITLLRLPFYVRDDLLWAVQWIFFIAGLLVFVMSVLLFFSAWCAAMMWLWHHILN